MMKILNPYDESLLGRNRETAAMGALGQQRRLRAGLAALAVVVELLMQGFLLGEAERKSC